MRLKRYNDFQTINEAPFNLELFQKSKDAPSFNDEQKEVLQSELGFDTVEKNHATMIEGNFIIKAFPILGDKDYSYQDDWLRAIHIKIYQVDANSKVEFVIDKEIQIGSADAGYYTTGDYEQKLMDGSGRIYGSQKREIMEFILKNLPTIGMHMDNHLGGSEDKYLNL